MARKPRQLRLRESQELLSAYSDAGMNDDYRYRFISDMINRFNRGRNLSTKQRTWLDSLIEEGVPQPKGDPVLIGRIDTALQTHGMQHCAEPLSDFRSRIVKGWELSEKQMAFLERILEEADEVIENGPWAPSDLQEEQIRQCVALAKSRQGSYWDSHPGETRALKAVKAYIEGSGHVDSWSVERIIKSFRGKLVELRNPYVEAGAMIWARVRKQSAPGTAWEWIAVPALIAGDALVDERSGAIVYPALVNGELTYKTQSELAKRKPRGLATS